MRFLELESSRTAYRADFAVYGAVVAGLGFALTTAPAPAWPLAAWVLLGVVSWSLLEYGLHRWVLHRVPPFRAMHEQHHRRPQARIGIPTAYSAALFGGLVAWPAWRLIGPWPACAFMAGLLAGYLMYSITHHLCHHARAPGAWMRRRQHWHARHHTRVSPAGCYGVSHGLWDHVFGTARPVLLPAHRPVRHTA